MIKLGKVANGYILKLQDTECGEIIYVFNNEESEAECVKDLLYAIKDAIGFYGDKFVKDGDIEIKVINGRKYEETI